MAQDFILVGGVENDGTGDSLRVASARINNNFEGFEARIIHKPQNFFDISCAGRFFFI